MAIKKTLPLFFVISTHSYAVEQQIQSLETDISNIQISAPLTCDNISNINIDIIKTKYEGIMNTEKQKIEQDINAIKSDAPDPNNVEGAIGLTFHFRDEQMEVKLDLPTIKMVDQKMSMDIPETAMKTQTWSWDFPQSYMELQCTQGIPETVVGTGTCETFGVKYSCPTITLRAGKEICLHVPKIRMVRNEVKLDIPEFTMKRQDWIMAIPETKMETQRIVFNYPALVVTNIEAKSKDLAKRGEELGKRSRDTLTGISDAMKSELTLASMNSVDTAFSCQKKQLSAQIRKAYNDLNAMQQGASASLNRATEMNASKEVLDSLTASSEKLLNAKKALIDQYVTTRREIESKRKEVLIKLNDALNAKPAEQLAENQ